MQYDTHALAPRLKRLLVTSLLVAAVGACEQAAPPPAPPPVDVATLAVEPRELPLMLEYAAQLRGVREVEVRARVSGILLERLYQEGARVEAGELLFRIDPAPFAAEVERARAEVGIQQANLDQARRERDRVLPLYERDLASRSERDEAVAAFEVATATLAAAEAALDRAELDLSYTEVRAPIGGLTSREVRSEGSLVNAGDDSSLLAYIVQSDPLYVEFSVPESDAALIQNARAAANERGAFVRVAETGRRPYAEAEIEFVAPRVDDDTGTVEIRAVLDNPDGALLPGRIVRARVEGVGIPGALVIPKRAVMRGADGPFVWVVGEAGQVEPRPLELGVTSGNDVMVAAGLMSGERVVVDGILKVQPGAVVNAVPLGRDAPAAAAAAPSGTGQ